MVQRKVPNKLGIQADHVKSEKRLGNLKPSSCQHQDGKNRGPDLKKKMKKSRSFKLSDIESFRSSPLKKNISQPGKPPPPPLNAPTIVATPQKQSPMKSTDGAPNYMKSTSSSEARKERPQVSSQKTRTASDSKNRHQRNSTTSKFSSASGNKPARGLTRSSSLKLVRTLTKTPSFKPVRASAKKCSRVVMCADMDGQRATCSSTLKDSKFPSYLMLNPGGTEAEGTSALKVCPYTYCSLNGHHHAPLPPLKCFLSARRHSLKTQKSLKLGGLSPRKAKLIDDGTKGIDTSQVIFDDKPAYKEADLGNSATSPLIEEVGMDFFIEIYAKSKEDDVEATGKSTQWDGEKINDSAKEVDEATVEHDNDEQVVGSLTDGSPKSEINFEDNFDQFSDSMTTEMDITKGFSEEQMVGDANEDYSPVLAQEDVSPGSLFNGSDIEGECQASIEEDDAISEATDMEWQEGQYSAPESDNEASYPIKNDYEPVIKNPDLQDEPAIRTDDIASNNEEIPADEVLQEVYEEESACFDAPCNDSDSEMDGTHQDGEIVESSQVSSSFSYVQLSSEDAFEELITTEEKGEETEADLTSTMITSGSTEEPIVEPTAVSEEIQEDGVPEAEIEISEADTQIEVAENNCTTDLTAEALNESIQDDDAAMWFQNQISDSSQNFNDIEQFETNEDYNGRQTQEDSETDQSATISDFGLEQVLPNGEAGDPMGDTKVDDNPKHQMTQPFQLDDIAENSYSSHETVDESRPAETQDDPSNGQYESFNVVRNHNITEKDEDKSKKFKIPSSLDSEEQSNTRMCKISLADNSSGEVHTMEIEDNTEADRAETCLATKDAASPTSGSTFFYARSNSNQELPNTCNTQKWTIGRKRPTTEDCEEPGKFNPREPNYLPMVPDPDAEKVDLRHQMMDERKNTEEWMLDYAIQQAVTKLAPARKRKVALLVEAFETVTPPKFETHLRHTSAAFAHARPIQACR